MPVNHYDVVIVGGRCAGASLAIRLAKSNLNILLVDRATFPSVPNVPSGPFVHPGTMQLLDELGLAESDYTHPGSKIEQFAVNFGDGVDAIVDTSRMQLDRNYLRGIDRHFFDNALWEHATRGAGVTARAGFAVTAILKDESDIVIGIKGKTADGEEETFTADLIVGADGRYSFTARQFGADIIEERNQHTSAFYMSDWVNVDDYAPECVNAISTYNTGKGFMILLIPIAERRYHIASIMKSSESGFGAQNHEQAYLDGLRQFPHLWKRLQNAERVGDIVGMRRIENGYRQAFGMNWALVGDAVHYKDPADGQGIYDALLGSKLLAQAILDWKHSGTSWSTAGEQYQQQLMNKTYPIFEETVRNIKRTLYMTAPGFIFKPMGRILMTNPEFQTIYLRYLSRALSPSDYNKATRKIPNYLMKGILSDLRNYFSRNRATA